MGMEKYVLPFLGNFPLSSKNVFQLIKIFLSHKIPKNKGNICMSVRNGFVRALGMD